MFFLFLSVVGIRGQVERVAGCRLGALEAGAG